MSHLSQTTKASPNLAINADMKGFMILSLKNKVTLILSMNARSGTRTHKSLYRNYILDSTLQFAPSVKQQS